MQKFFQNKKMLVMALSLFFVAVITVTGVAAAMTGGVEPPSPVPPGQQVEEPQPPESEAPVDPDPDSEPDQGPGLEVTPITYNAPSEMRAVYLTPGQDFFATADWSEAKVKAEIDAALQKIQDLSMNTVIVQTAAEKGVIYRSDCLPQLAPGFDPLGHLITAAKGRGLYVYCIYNLLTVPGPESLIHADPVDASVIDLMQQELTGFVRDYKPDGILLADYENPNHDGSYSGYLSAGGGIGYQRYMQSVPTLVVELASNIIHTRVPGMQAGLLTRAVWANQSQNQAGSATKAAYAALTDGNADVRAFVQNGLVDFVMVEALGAQADPAIPFVTVAKWWGKLASDAGIPLYLTHGADRMGTSAAGWADAGQLVSQLVAAKTIPGYKGSSFNSLKQLVANPGGATTNLLDYFKDQNTAKFILAQLEMTRPAQLTFTTSEPTITFQGASDPRSEVTLGGQKVQTSDTGYFLVEAPLKAGLNTFKIEHKGKVLTYNITRQVNVIHSIAPEGSLSVEGGMQITTVAYAYEGASVSATLGGSTIQLARDQTDDDSTNKDSSYVKYSGTFTAPAGTGAAQKLGNITVNASFEGYTGTKQGASVTVNKRVAIGSGKPVVIAAADAETFPTSTLNDISSPNCFPLPKGALDYTLGDELVYKDGNTTYRYYTLESGQRVYAQDVSSTATQASGNKITGMTVTSTAAYTDVILKMDQKAAYRASYSSSGMKFDFQYTTAVPGNLSNLTKNPLFKSATWSGTTLSLNFRVSDGMVGYRASYDSTGNLVLRFHNVPASLSGAKVVVDPGHGGTDFGALGYLTAYPEKVVNWQIARRLASALESKGANVLLINTQVSSGKVDLPNRMNQANSFNPQAFVSIHNNSATSKTATGHEAYYFYSFSQGLASRANGALDSAIGNRDRGTKYGLYYVTRTSRFASTLTEGAFMSNENEFYDLIDDKIQQQIADQMATAIGNFFKSRYAGSYPTGTESVGAGVQVKPTKLTLDKATLAMTLGQEAQQLTPKFEPADTTDQTVTWTSSDETVAKVDQDGKVTALKVGTATITATSQADNKLKATCVVTVTGKAVTGVTLDKTKVDLTPGSTLTLTATLAPADATNKEVTWTSSNPAMVAVDQGGKITVPAGAAVGQTATITVTTKDGGKTAACDITIKAAVVPVTGVKLNQTTAELTMGGTVTLALTATVEPETATNKNLSWKSGDTAVATVDSNGKVTAVGAGTATITVTTEDGGKAAVCEITVKAAATPVTEVVLNYPSAELTEGGTLTLTATVKPDNATNKKVTWTTSDSSVATVNGGVVTAMKEGTAIITATTEDGGKTATCQVTVKAKAPAEPVLGSISLSPLTLAVGESGSMSYTLTPAEYSPKSTSWSASPDGIITISGSQVTANQEGTATVTVTIDGKTATATVTVKAAP